MLGINQTIMMALSMLVITALVGPGTADKRSISLLRKRVKAAALLLELASPVSPLRVTG